MQKFNLIRKEEKIKANTLKLVNFSFLFFALIFLFSFSSVSAFDFPHTIVNIDFTGNLTNISQMQDVDTSGVTNGQLLIWNSAAGAWEPDSAGAGDILAVNTNGPYLQGGATSGEVDLLLSESYLNGTIITIATALSGGNTSFNQTLTDSLYYLITNPSGFYNSSDFSITDYYLNTNPSNYWNDTFATFNKTYADTLYATIGSGGNASFNQTLTDSLYIAQADEGNLNVNSSDYWDNLDTFNTTQMENDGGQLHILLSWFTTTWNSIFSSKTTDDLTEGSTNLYDNSSWNASALDNVAGTGDCPAGQFVVNTTTGGVECDAPAGSGDITSVQGDDIYIYNGSDSGDVILVMNETKLNLTGDERYVNIDGDTWEGDMSAGNYNLTDIQQLVFNTTGCNETSTEGTICWNSEDKTLNIVTGLGNVEQVGQEQWALAKNGDSQTLYNGQVVSLVGSSGDRGQVARADASNISLASRLSIITADSCTVSADCPVTTFGRVRELDTSAWVDGTLLYLSDDGSGNLTSTAPEFPNFRVLIAFVVRSHANDGIIFVQPQIDYTDGVTLNELYVRADFTVNGSSKMNGNLNMSGNNITGLNSLISSTGSMVTRGTPETDLSGADNAFSLINGRNITAGEVSFVKALQRDENWIFSALDQIGMSGFANVRDRSFIFWDTSISKNATELMNCTARQNNLSVPESLQIDCATDATGADIILQDDLLIGGDFILKDTEDDWHFMTRSLTVQDELNNNLLLSRSNVSLVGTNFTITDEDADSIIVTIDTKETIMSDYTDSVTAVAGTNSSPAMNFITYQNKDNPTLTRTPSQPTGDFANVARFYLGEADNIYGGIGGRSSVDEFIRGSYLRWFNEGPLYVSGFQPTVNATNISIGVGSMTILLDTHSHAETFDLVGDGAFLILNNGDFVQFNSLEDITQYSDGGTIGNNKYYNLVCGFVHNDVNGNRMMCVVQSTPSSEYTSNIGAETDTYDSANVFPSDSFLKNVYLPVSRMVIQKVAGTDEFQVLSNGERYIDVRGATSSAGAPASSGITVHSDLTGLDYASSGHTGFLGTTDEPNLNVNSSNYWDEINTFNSSELEQSGTFLGINKTWLTSFFNNLFGTKDTDDLTEGSINLYDNQSWNETYADILYADISVDGTVTSVAAGDGMDFTTITTTGSVTMGTPSTLNGGTSNGVSGTGHTHAVTTDDTGTCATGEICGGGHTHAASEVTTGTFGTGNYVMDTNLTVEKLVFENSASHFMEDNSTCVKIYGSTSVLEIC